MESADLHREIERRLEQARGKIEEARKQRRQEIERNLDQLILERAERGKTRVVVNCVTTREDTELDLSPREVCLQYCEKHKFILGASTQCELVIIFKP